jgi:hypothetical protein
MGGKITEEEITSELLRRGFSVTKSPNGGLQVEKKAFWGGVSYNTKSGATRTWLNKRTWLLVLLYGLGLLGMIYWYAFGVKSIVKEITSVSV